MSHLDPRLLRTAFGSYMTGVTVVTCVAADGTPAGFTANSFSSVSLDPPLLLVCPGKFLSTFEHFATCAQFAVNVLAEGQEDVANTFASFKGDRFARTPHSSDALGNPVIDGALAQFSCTTHQVIDAGDHAILMGQVRAFSHDAGAGLGYVGGQFFSLGLERAALDHSGRKVVFGAIATQGTDVVLEPTPSGYRPPQVVAQDRGDLRRFLATGLAAQGLHVRLGPAYSVFDEGKTHFSYCLADVQILDASAFELHPIDALPRLTYASQPVADMMHRFALEAQTRSFGLYIGDAQRGDIHHQTERT